MNTLTMTDSEIYELGIQEALREQNWVLMEQSVSFVNWKRAEGDYSVDRGSVTQRA